MPLQDVKRKLNLDDRPVAARKMAGTLLASQEGHWADRKEAGTFQAHSKEAGILLNRGNHPAAAWSRRRF
jgi:hypothetical protein